MASGAKRASIRVVISYIIDWIIIIAIAAVGAAFSAITPNKRPFDVTDPDISFPFVVKEKISTGLLVAIGLAVPAVVIFVVCMFLGLGPATDKAASSSNVWKRKLWEWNASWMGLGVSLAVAFLITDGTKNLVGRPRPDLLARCNPDLTRLLSSAVGGVGSQIDEGTNLVSWTICRNPGATLDDGFRSFPSGHSSFSFAGLTYLALFLCAKLAITVPFLNYQNIGQNSSAPLRRQAAAPPTYLLIFPLIPIGAAIYISTTRYSDFYHHGFDIIAGAALGIASAWLGFRMYHLPVGRGGGWAWAPRAPDRAFGRVVGLVTYGSNDVEAHREGHRDIEVGPVGVVGSAGGGFVRPYKTSNGSEGIQMDDLSSAGPAGGSDSSQRPLR